MFDITTVGHFSIDFISSPRRPVTRPTLGGPPTYTSLAARSLDAKVSVLSKVGEDFPRKYEKWLCDHGVDLSGLRQVTGAKTTSFGLAYLEKGERQLTLKSKAPPLDVADVPDRLDSKAVHIAPIVGEVTFECVDKLRSLAEVVSLDPQGLLRFFGENGDVSLGSIKDSRVFGKVDIIRSSEREIEIAAGQPDLQRAIRNICEHGARIAIVTRGEEASLLYLEGEFYWIPAALPRVVVDPTGAGDSFMGAFLAEYVHEKDPVWCACVGSASASFVVEKPGPTGFGSAKQVYERAREVYSRVSSARIV